MDKTIVAPSANENALASILQIEAIVQDEKNEKQRIDREEDQKKHLRYLREELQETKKEYRKGQVAIISKYLKKDKKVIDRLSRSDINALEEMFLEKIKKRAMLKKYFKFLWGASVFSASFYATLIFLGSMGLSFFLFPPLWYLIFAPHFLEGSDSPIRFLKNRKYILEKGELNNEEEESHAG